MRYADDPKEYVLRMRAVLLLESWLGQDGLPGQKRSVLQARRGSSFRVEVPLVDVVLDPLRLTRDRVLAGSSRSMRP